MSFQISMIFFYVSVYLCLYNECKLDSIDFHCTKYKQKQLTFKVL